VFTARYGLGLYVIQLVPRLWQLLGDLSMWRSEWDVADKVALGQVFLQYFPFLLSVSFHQCCTPIFIYMLLLSEEQMGEAWEPSPEQQVTSSSSHTNNSRAKPRRGPTDNNSRAKPRSGPTDNVVTLAVFGNTRAKATAVM